MKAAVLTDPGHIELVDRQEPTCGQGEVLVRITGVGICGSDLTVYGGGRTVPELPWVMGHEGVGVISAVGPNVSDRHVGQRVVIEPNYPCFHCPACIRGETCGCLNKVMIGMNTPGLLTEYVVIPARFAWPTPPGLTDRQLVCLEPLTVATAAVRRSGGVETGQRCLVIGAGSTGLIFCATLLANGVRPDVIEPHAGRAELAASLGARIFQDGVDRDYDRVYETSGSAPAVEQALELARDGGTVTLTGLGTHPFPSTSAAIVRHRLTIVGSLIYDHPRDFAATLAAPLPDLDRVIRAEFPLEKAQEAFENARAVPGKSWISVES
jgi:2-desacetyl-2-hydroxyethyl bacteriochlorophyllide A dehydrogenase